MAGVSLPPVIIEGEYAVHLEPAGMASAAGGGGKVAVVEYAKDSFGLRIGLLATVLFPDFLCEGKLAGGELTGDGFGHVIILRD